MVLVCLAGCDSTLGLAHLPLCEAGTPFATGTPVPLDGAYSVEAARFTSDQTIAYLSLCPASPIDKSKCDLYQSAFSTKSRSFGLFAKLDGLDSTVYDAYPTITPDEQYILFGSDRSGTIGVYIATAQNGSFSAPQIARLTTIPNEAHSNEPYALGDNQTIYLGGASHDRTSGDDLWRATGGPPSYGVAQRLDSLDTDGSENAPVVSDDEREIFFASDRDHPGMSGLDGLDIYTATRTRASDAFGAPVHLPALSSDGIDWPVWLSPSHCDLYYINKVDALATLYETHRN
jgi:hypothetical protein